jgi:hypothetical protein
MSTVYLQLQSTASGRKIGPRGPIPFDTVPNIQSENIMYIPGSSMVLLQTAGTYLVEWSVSASSMSPIEIGLTTSTAQGTIIGSNLSAPSQVSGSAVIVVPDNSMATLYLSNQSQFDLTLSNLPVVANLVIYAYIPDGAPGGGDDGGGSGSAKGRLSIPFSSAFGPTCYPSIDINGKLTQVSIIGCGQSNDLPVYFNVSGGTVIQIPFSDDRAQYLFSFPYNVRLVAVSAIFNNGSTILLNQPTTIISPFVSVAKQAITGTYTFDIIEESEVYPNPGYQMLSIPPQNIPTSTILTTVKTNLDIPIPAGMPFVIIGGLINLGLSRQALSAQIYMHGSMIFEIDE